MIHAQLLTISIALLLLFILCNWMRSERLDVSLLQSLLRPSQLVLFYMIVFFIAGSLFFLTENVMRGQWLTESLLWSHWHATFFATVSALAILVSNFLRLGPKISSFCTNQSENHYYWEIPALLFAVGAAVAESLILLSFSTALYFAGAAGGRIRSWIFILFFVSGVVPTLPTFAHGKRLLIFPVLIVLALATRDGAIRPKSFIVLCVVSLLAILPFSIMRGYGNFGAETFVDAIRYVGVYISSDYFIAALGNNTESVSFYFHGMNALSTWLQSEEYLWGESIFNMFFLGSSLYGFDDGLNSAIQIYTLEHDPSFRAIGGSYPVMVLSEFVMNFGVFSIILFPAFLVLLDTLWRKIRCIAEPTVRFSLEASVLYVALLLARGSSFDLSLYNLIVLGVPILVFVSVCSRLRFRKSAHA